MVLVQLVIIATLELRTQRLVLLVLSLTKNVR